MIRINRRSTSLWIFLALVLCFALGAAAQMNSDLFSGLQWRNVGPFHGGRIASVTGVIGEPGTFYAGMPQGGIWKTTSGGMTWYPVFDSVTEVDSIGAIQVAPSNPNIIYAGSGDAIGNASTGTNGDGMYKSTDAGKTWTKIGLDGTTQNSENYRRSQRSQYRDRRHHGRCHRHAARNFSHRRWRPILEEHVASR